MDSPIELKRMPMRTLFLLGGEVRVFPDGALARAAADEFQRVIAAAVAAHGQGSAALAGGSTPRAVHTLLAADERSGRHPLPWNAVQIFFGDERFVPADHADSNFRMAAETLLAHVPIPEANIHRVRTELSAEAAAADYEQEVRRVVSARAAESTVPRFDLVLLGMGPDGHTASLFPGTAVLQERTRLVVANEVPQLKTWRITFTYPLVNAAAEVLIVAGGADKAAMLRNVLRGDPRATRYPVQDVRPVQGRLLWLVDEAAAAQIE